MAEPALELAPAEEVAAEETAKQTTRLVLIEGGEGTAAGTGELVAGETLGEGILAGVGATALAIGAFFLVLLWPSEIGPEPSMGPRPKPVPVPAPAPRPVIQPCPKEEDDESKKRRYTVAIHAQGVDCGGKTSSTIGAPAITQPVPVAVAEGLALSASTQAMLNRSQLGVREEVIAKADRYITTGPANGGRFGKKSFLVLGVRGGLRYDVDCHGDGPSFVS
jgi:hypothetical protein